MAVSSTNYLASINISKINLVEYHAFLKLREKDGIQYVFDPVRKKELQALPEELVRQSWIQFLHHRFKISMASLGVEKSFNLDKSIRRFDLVLYRKGEPYILFEFKSFNKKITDAIGYQAAGYNMKLKVPFVILSNGLHHFAYFVNHESKDVKSLDNLGFIED